MTSMAMPEPAMDFIPKVEILENLKENDNDIPTSIDIDILEEKEPVPRISNLPTSLVAVPPPVNFTSSSSVSMGDGADVQFSEDPSDHPDVPYYEPRVSPKLLGGGEIYDYEQRGLSFTNRIINSMSPGKVFVDVELLNTFNPPLTLTDKDIDRLLNNNVAGTSLYRTLVCFYSMMDNDPIAQNIEIRNKTLKQINESFHKDATLTDIINNTKRDKLNDIASVAIQAIPTNPILQYIFIHKQPILLYYENNQQSEEHITIRSYEGIPLIKDDKITAIRRLFNVPSTNFVWYPDDGKYPVLRSILWILFQQNGIYVDEEQLRTERIDEQAADIITLAGNVLNSLKNGNNARKYIDEILNSFTQAYTRIEDYTINLLQSIRNMDEKQLQSLNETIISRVAQWLNYDNSQVLLPMDSGTCAKPKKIVDSIVLATCANLTSDIIYNVLRHYGNLNDMNIVDFTYCPIFESL